MIYKYFFFLLLKKIIAISEQYLAKKVIITSAVPESDLNFEIILLSKGKNIFQDPFLMQFYANKNLR